MTENKHDIALIVSDIDGTITPFWDIAVQTGDKLFDRATDLYKEFNPEQTKSMDKKQIRAIFDKEILDRGETDPGMREYYIHNTPRLLESLETLKPKTPEQEALYEKRMAEFKHDWDIDRGERTKELLPGVLQTVSKLKKAGGKFVLYSDAPETSVSSRLLLMPEKLLEQIDMVVSQPDDNAFMKMPGGVEKNGPLVKLTSLETSKKSKALDGKFLVMPEMTGKPNNKMLKEICKMMGVKEKNTLMVGDMPNDVLCVEGTEAKSAFQKQGAHAAPETIKVHNEKIPQPIGMHEYRIGIEVALRKFKEKGVTPHLTLEKGYADIPKTCNFIKANEKTDVKKMNPAFIKKFYEKGR